MKTDYNKLNNLINEWYEMLYKGSAPVGAEDKKQAVQVIEKFMNNKNNIPFLKNLYNVRKDYFTSDREYQALYFALIESDIL